MALSVSDIVNIDINLQALASARRNFGTLLIIGASEIIGQGERIRTYKNIAEVTADFGIYSPEQIAAELYFSQSPRPSVLQIGRWIKNPVPAELMGGTLFTIERDLSLWMAVTDGTLSISINGVTANLTDIDLSEEITLEGVAYQLSEQLKTYGAVIAFDGERFKVTTVSAGATAKINYATGTLAEMMRLTAETALAPLPGKDSETAKEAIVELADCDDWYGAFFADRSLSVQDHADISGFIEASAKSRIYAVTATDPRTLDKDFSQDVASQLKALKRIRTIVVYSQHPYAVVSALGRAFTTNFNANKSTITLKFKQLPGIVAEGLKSRQSKALKEKRCNFYANYENGTAIFEEGVMSGDAFFDEIHGLDWLQNAAQNECFNLLYQSKNKIPQTDSGANQIVATIEGVMGEAAYNRLIAPGIWNADGFGQLERGDLLDKGYYIYVQRMDLQPQSEREQRKAPPVQAAVKLAGAIHSINAIINVNR